MEVLFEYQLEIRLMEKMKMNLMDNSLKVSLHFLQ
jgi:hypothetical protein